MERRANVPPPPAFRSVAGEPNAATSPELLRYIHAAIKRHKPHSSMQSNVVGRASRVLVSPAECSKFSIPSSTITGNKICKKPSRSLAVLESAKLSNLGLDQRKDSAIEVKSQQEDAYLTPPSLTATVTSVLNENTTPTFDTQRGSMEPASDENKNSVTVPSSRLHVNGNVNLASQKDDNDDDSHLGNREVMGDDRSRGHPQVSGSCLTFIEGDNILERGNKVRHNEDYVNPMTRSSVACSSFATTMSVHSGPTFQSTHAHFPGQTTFGIKDHGVVEERINVLMEGVGLQGHQQAPHLGEHVKSHVAITNERHLLSQLPSTTPLPNVDHDPSQLNRVEKAPRKKKYDPDLFFKVNGKLYQKLGKIGSGGSSEVHKVISSDCTIYALKKIKLKGREYQTAYGFCQEIVYLNRLKGRDNIIQLIDFEVTDKTLLEGVVNGTINTRDGKIKDDHYIYMVLEYGEIDLAHMVSHKWKDMDSSNWKMDENWLRFYWQQMLEAVNTIHEERIVHSDLKPANFLLVRGSLKLIDFGIAKAIMSDTTNIQRDTQVGTLNYMSPEAFMWNEHDSSGNTIKCGRPSDIWSLGCILYQMVYGKTPFSAYKTFWAKFKVITDRNHEISFGPVSNPWLVDLMRRCLAWDRSERWRIPQLLRHPFLVPPIPTDVPRSDGHEFELLLQRCSGHWSDPEVVRVCAELSTVVAKIEEREKGVGVQC